MQINNILKFLKIKKDDISAVWLSLQRNKFLIHHDFKSFNFTFVAVLVFKLDMIGIIS